VLLQSLVWNQRKRVVPFPFVTLNAPCFQSLLQFPVHLKGEIENVTVTREGNPI
jgi:hypothetical protein